MSDLKKRNDFVWEIEKDESQGMNVPVRIYANEEIAHAMQSDRTLRQATNAAALPKIVKHMLVMPDGHEGYGFPVGGVAAFDSDDGIISPGAIGFDINCLHPDTKIYDDNQTWKKISKVVEGDKVNTLDLYNNQNMESNVVLALSREKSKLLEVRTACGKILLTTGDHKILTHRGMIKACDLNNNDQIVVTGFEGLEYTEPVEDIIVAEKDLVNIMNKLGITDKGNAKRQMLNQLGKLGLLDIRHNSPKLSLLIKLLGFVMGDGTIPNGKSIVTFYGKEEDLKDVKADIEKLGFKAEIYSRERDHRIETIYGTQEFKYIEYSLHVSSKSFKLLLLALGAPLGNRSTVRYRIPDWLMRAEKWQIRLFVAAYFGAELSKPITNNQYNFQMPALSVSKLVTLKDNATEFLLDIKQILSWFEVETSEPQLVQGYRYNGKNGESIGVRLCILSNTPNLIRFFGTVSYIYNRQKNELASLTVLYLNYLDSIRKKKMVARKKAIMLYNNGAAPRDIIDTMQGEEVGEQFLLHSIYGRSGTPRVWESIGFDDFCIKYKIANGYMYDGIKEIRELGYDGKVYDIGVDNWNHNFIANGIIVSNCGVRVVKTNLTHDELKPKLHTLMDALFKNVPSGVGSKINLGFTQKDIERVSMEGVSYIVEKGYGISGDVEATEESGVMEGGNFSKVSSLAKKRGLHQLGTLGAGNHFLEVQRVDKLYNKQIAEAFGLYEDQVVVMLHSGSRGYGHQICSDYLRTLAEYQSSHNISLRDPELSYAHTGSKEADDYLEAMKCAVNFAFANRQIMMQAIRKSFEDTFGKSSDALGMELLYDVAHNIAKLEEHVVDGKRMKLYVHRKGATRAFGPGRAEVPKAYRKHGQPVLIPGSMQTSSYVLAGTEGSMRESFGSSCHGSGRTMSRHRAIREIPSSQTLSDMKTRGIEFRVRDRKLISEESRQAYKNVDAVVQSVEGAGLSQIVAKLVPLGVAKG